MEKIQAEIKENLAAITALTQKTSTNFFNLKQA
jgi:hypothetical protein